jgi:hypothetical protein
MEGSSISRSVMPSEVCDAVAFLSQLGISRRIGKKKSFEKTI